MVMIVVSGPPATGKTAIANALEQTLGWPVISKDRIKERLFDERGTGDGAWSRQLGKESYEIVEQRTRELFARGKSFLLEGNYIGMTADHIRDEAIRFSYQILFILCDAPDNVILARFKARWESGSRHPGHVDNQTLDEVARGRSWDEYRHYSFSNTSLCLDASVSLEENITKATAFVRQHVTEK
jgi:predicted kinase